MGNKTNVEENSSLLPNELQDFSNITNFSDDALIRLHNHYKRISSLQTDDGVIDYAEFSEIICRDNNMTKRIFNAIDINRDGVINFREFIKYLSIFTNGGEDDKINLSFKLFSDHKTKLIYENDMILMLLDIVSVDSSNFVKSFFGKEEISMIVKETFKTINEQELNITSKIDKNNITSQNIELNINNSNQKNKQNQTKINEQISNNNENQNQNQYTIDFKGYKTFIKTNPFILNWLKVDVNEIEKPTNKTKKSKSIKKDCYHC